jgi:hypothetical protein
MYKLQTIHYNSRYNHRNNQINLCTKNNVLLIRGYDAPRMNELIATLKNM